MSGTTHCLRFYAILCPRETWGRRYRVAVLHYEWRRFVARPFISDAAEDAASFPPCKLRLPDPAFARMRNPCKAAAKGQRAAYECVHVGSSKVINEDVSAWPHSSPTFSSNYIGLKEPHILAQLISPSSPVGVQNKDAHVHRNVLERGSKFTAHTADVQLLFFCLSWTKPL